MKIPTLTELHPRIGELESKRNALQIEKNAKVAEAAIVRARIQNAPSPGNAAENRVRAILGEAPLPDAAPDMLQLDALLRELNDLNKALGILDSHIQRERAIGSRLVCETVQPEVTRLGKRFGKALLDLHAAHLDYSQFIDSVETTGASVSSLGRVSPSWLGSPLDTCGGYHYMARDFIEAEYVSKSDLHKAIR